MAGYALGFDDGGGVDNDTGMQYSAQQPDDDGAMNIPDDQASPVPPSMGAPQQQPNAWENNFDEAKRGVQNVGVAAKKIIAYLMGAGATPPQAAAAAADQVKANDPQMSDDDANLLAVHEAGQRGGPAAAWAMLQYNRAAYNAKQAFARTALNGIDGKAGDVSAAAQAATQAGAHVLDGSSAIFTSSPEGVTATVRGADGNNSQYALTPQQFNHYLDLGKTSQYDVLMRDGINGALQKVTGQDQGQAPQTGGEGETSEEDTTTPPAAASPSMVDLSGGQKGLRGYKPMDYDAFNDDNSSSTARANQLYPHATAEDAAQRAAYIKNDEEREAQGQVKKDVAKLEGEKAANVASIHAGAQRDVAGTRAEAQRNVADTRAKAYEDAAAKKYAALDRQTAAKAQSAMAALEQKAKQFETQRGDKRSELIAKNLRAQMSNINAGLNSDDTKAASAAVAALTGLNARLGVAPQAPTPTSVAPAQQAPVNNQPAQSRQFTPQNLPASTARRQGDVVTTNKGTFTWNGSGWDKQ